MKRTRAAVAMLLASIVGTVIDSTSKAEGLSPIDHKWHFDVGMFFLDTDTTVRVDGTSGRLGSELDFKHDFGFEDQDRFRIDGYWRFAKRHKLRFMYFDSSSSSERTLNRDIHFGDVDFPLNAYARASVKTQIIELAYEYSFVRSNNFELAATAGLHNLKISTDLTAAVSSNFGSGGFNRGASAEGNGPLPVIGLRFIWALSDQFYFDGLAQFFAVEIDKYDGSLGDFKLDFIWQPFKHAGVGIGYNQFTTRLDTAEERFTGRLKFEYGGPLLFVTMAF